MRKKFRNTLLAIAGVSATVGAGMTVDYADRQIKEGPTKVKSVTEANQYLDSFPDELPGASEIIKHRITGASKCLIVVKQAHYGQAGIEIEKSYRVSGDNESADRLHEINKAVFSDINALQKNIYLIEQSMPKKPEDKMAFYEEGLHEGVVLDRLKASALYSKILTDLAELEYLDSEVLDRYIGSISSGNQLDKDDSARSEEFKYLPGGNLIFAINGGAKLKSPERKEIMDIAKSNSSAPHRKDYNADLREDSFISDFANSPYRFGVVNYAFQHAVISDRSERSIGRNNNIDEWNRQHPQNTISVILIIPKGLDNLENKIFN